MQKIGLFQEDKKGLHEVVESPKSSLDVLPKYQRLLPFKHRKLT